MAHNEAPLPPEENATPEVVLLFTKFAIIIGKLALILLACVFCLTGTCFPLGAMTFGNKNAFGIVLFFCLAITFLFFCAMVYCIFVKRYLAALLVVAFMSLLTLLAFLGFYEDIMVFLFR